MEITLDNAPEQRTLGVAWDVKRDVFVMRVNIPDKAFTRRGILSVVNTTFDPLGMASPIVLRGRLLQRRIMAKDVDAEQNPSNMHWDDPLPDTFLKEWKAWIQTLAGLDRLTIP